MSQTLDTLKSPGLYAKAIVAAATAFGASFAVAREFGITTSEWVMIGVATVVAGAGVFAVPNKDPEGTHQDESVQPPDNTNNTPPRVIS